MSDFTVNDYFQLFGPNTDLGGGREINLGGAIGGGESVGTDHIDETLAFVDNNAFLWGHGNRRHLWDATYYGSGASQASITGTDVGDTQRFEVPVQLATGRGDITFYYDFENAHLTIECFNVGGVSIGGPSVISNSARVQGSTTIASLSSTTVVIKVSLRIHTGGSYELFSLYAKEGEAASTGFTYRIDRDAVADYQPYDTWLLQRLADGVAGVQAGRSRGASWAFDFADPLILSSFEAGAVCLGQWPATRRFDEVKLLLRHKTQYASTWFDLAVMTTGGLTVLEPETELTTSASIQQTTLTLDLSDYEGQEVVIFILHRAEEDAATQVDMTSSEITLRDFEYITFDTGAGGYVALTADTRYTVRLYVAAGAPPEGDFPLKRQLLYDKAGRWYVYPSYTASDDRLVDAAFAVAGSYDVQATRLGQTAIYGMALYESDHRARPDMKPALRAGRLPALMNIRRLHKRAYGVFKDHTPVHHVGGVMDPGNVDSGAGGVQVLQVGSLDSYFTSEADWTTNNGFKTIGSAMAGAFDKSKTPAAANQVRSTLVITGLVMLAGSYSDQFYLDIRAKVGSWTGANWSGNSNTTDTEVLVMDSLGRIGVGAGRLWAWKRLGSTGSKHYHHLRGSFPAQSLAVNYGGLYAFRFEVDSSDPGADQRLIQVQAQGRDRTTRGTVISENKSMLISMVSLSVWTKESVA
jgi:hypothetical protein